MKARRLSKPGLRVGLDARLAFRRGVGTYTAQLAMALARVENGLQLFLLNAPPLLKERLQGSRARFLDVASVNPILYEQFQLPSMAHRESLDLLHYTDNSGAVFASPPYVLTLHDAMMMRPGAETHDGATLRQRAVGFYKRWVACPSGRAARLVLTVSEYSKRDIAERMGLPPEKIRVVPEGVETGAFARPLRFKKSSNKFPVVLVQGAVDKRKNIPGVLKAAAFLKGRGTRCVFRIIGYPKSDFERAGYVGLAEHLGVGDRVQWAGQVSPERLAQEYWEADLFLYASLWEGFGLPVLESFAAGTPVVASDSTSIPEVAGGAALLADPTNPEELALRVQQVLIDKKFRNTMVAKGFRRVKMFTWEKAASATAEVYREASEGGSR